MNTHSAPTLLDSNPGSNPSAGLPSLPAAPRRPARPLSLAATLATLAFAPFVDGAVVLSNLAGMPGTGSGTINVGSSTNPAATNSNTIEAVKVTTGAGNPSWTVTSVSILGYFSFNSRMVIWAGTPGTLGNAAYVSDEYSGTFDYDASLKRTFTFAAPVTLTGGASYWFGLYSPANPTGWSAEWTFNSNATPVTSVYGWVQSNQETYTNSSGTWAASSGRNYASLEIEASVGASGVPDGTTTALLLAPLGLGLAWAGRRRGQAGRP